MPDSHINTRQARTFDAPSTRARAFHRLLHAYAPTPLRVLNDLGVRLGVGAVLVKDDSSRLGLPAYKILGGSWAVARMLARDAGADPAQWTSWDDVRALAVDAMPRRLVTATDGNHGRAVAHAARMLGLTCSVHVPRGTARARIDAIESEGADVVEGGGYEDSVARALAGAQADPHAWLVQDTANPGHEDAPRWCAEGYSTLFQEIDEQLDAKGEPAPDVAIVQIGVGTLADAMVRHMRSSKRWEGVGILGVEPMPAPCALASARAGVPTGVHVADAHATIMAGLNCGTISAVAWEAMRDGIDVFLAVEDEWAERAMRLLAVQGVESGESGAAGLAGLLAMLYDDTLREARAALRLGPASRVLLLNTEGATDPVAFARIVGCPPQGVGGAMERLAVYGSLAPGGKHHDVLAGLRGTWREGTIGGRLAPGAGPAKGYPVLTLAPESPATRVEVRVFESPDLPDHWPRLSAFEGPGYRREGAVVTLEGGARVVSQVFVAADPA